MHVVLLQDVTNPDRVQRFLLLLLLFFRRFFFIFWFVQLLEMENDERTEKRSLRITERVNY